MTAAGAPGFCLVCRAPGPRAFMSVGARDYWRCDTCEATFLDPRQRLPLAQERAHYLLHENDPNDLAYRRFLSKLADPLIERLPEGSRGLDYGCGPGPALAAMLREAGHATEVYDPCFAPDPAPLARRHAFVTCTETAEHFHDPASEFDRLDALLEPGGWLAVVTSFQTEDARFARWRYRMDPTHVVFYRQATFAAISDRRGWHCEFPCKDVALMRKAS